MNDRIIPHNYEVEDRIPSLKGLKEYIDKIPERWVYRAQSAEYDLQATFERECLKSGINKEDRKKIETHLIRHFRRVYSGLDEQEVRNDSLYCLSLMRHFGAPVRLLDFTYSKHIAMYFALEVAYNNILKKEKPATAIWCVDIDELENRVSGCYKELASDIDARGKSDEARQDDKVFQKLYMENNYNLALWENPYKIHQRLHLQQGVFMCQGNVTQSFMHNLMYPYQGEKTDKIKKISCCLSQKEILDGLLEYRRMNISRESLFPGLDGFAQAMSYEFQFYKILAGIGGP